MNLKGTFLRTKVARRILGLFVLCAVLPITALSVISYRQVASHLSDQSRERLRQAGKIAGMGVYERLRFLDTELTMVAEALSASSAERKAWHERGPGLLATLPLATLTIQNETTETTALLGSAPELPRLTVAQREHLKSNKALLASDASRTSPSLFMARSLHPGDLSHGVLWAELDRDYLFGIGGQHAPVSPGVELCVFDDRRRSLHCSVPLASSAEAKLHSTVTSADAAQFEWATQQGERYLAGYWSLFLGFDYAVQQWTFVSTEPKASVLAPVAGLRRVFPMTIVIALLVVMLLANIQIRKSMAPLEELHQGTTRIAEGNFKDPVEVSSRDEFEDLAASFNKMARRLGKQFNALTTINEIDRAVLAALDTDRIVDTVLSRSASVFGCDCVGITLSRAGPRSPMTTVAASEVGRVTQEVQLTQTESRQLQENPDCLRVRAGEELPGYLQTVPFTAPGISSVLVLPIFLRQELTGLIALGYRDASSGSEDDVTQARQLADQVAVALANARLIEELADLNWGTLTALARTIDAKSRWTAGHAERVTKLALALGERLHLDLPELDRLHRGALLHDIGKIGIRAAILDKETRLTHDEEQMMASHPQIGARILSPIAAYADVIPLVRHHHERFDGSGYPDGLSGEGIPYLARILAVADVFDALRSDRPYRSGLTYEEAMEVIRQGSGTQFDPDVVQALEELLEDEAVETVVRPGPLRSIGSRVRYAS